MFSQFLRPTGWAQAFFSVSEKEPGGAASGSRTASPGDPSERDAENRGKRASARPAKHARASAEASLQRMIVLRKRNNIELHPRDGGYIHARASAEASLQRNRRKRENIELHPRDGGYIMPRRQVKLLKV